jgi:S-adenosyl-L-methionine hydrolase (adenosine-forming)
VFDVLHRNLVGKEVQITMPPIITLTSDFGTRDGFTAQMKGVILGINPAAHVLDVTHEIVPFAVLEGALVLKGISRYFPPRTVHVGVVDPGVGGSRRGIAVRAGDSFYVGPDNGLFTFVVSADPQCEIRELQDRRYFLEKPHPTFHGRDIFAPVAAHLTLGVPFDSLGPTIQDPVTLPVPPVRATPFGLEGQVIYIDRFGNLTSNIDASLLVRPVRAVEVGDVRILGISQYFGQVSEGQTLSLINSFGYIEIAMNRENAFEQLGFRKGDRVRIEWGVMKK